MLPRAIAGLARLPKLLVSHHGFFFGFHLAAGEGLQLFVQPFRQGFGFRQSSFAGMNLSFQFRRSPLQLAKVTTQGQRPGIRSFAAGNHAMVVVRAGRRQEVAVRVSARQALGGGIIFHHEGGGEGGQRQMLAVYASGSRKATLPSVKAPTLVIHGADDPLLPLAAGEDTAATIPGAKLVVLPRMGHALPLAVWPQVIDEIVELVKRAP